MIPRNGGADPPRDPTKSEPPEKEVLNLIGGASHTDGIKKEQLKRHVFTLDFKAEVVRHKKAENLSFTECGRKFEVLPKLIQQWERQYEAGQLTAAAGLHAVSPEQGGNYPASCRAVARQDGSQHRERPSPKGEGFK